MNLNTQNIIAAVAAAQRTIHEIMDKIDGSTTVDHEETSQDHVQILRDRAVSTKEKLDELMHALGGLRGEAAEKMQKHENNYARVLHFKQIGWRLMASGMTDSELDGKIARFKLSSKMHTFSNHEREILESLEAEKRVR